MCVVFAHLAARKNGEKCVGSPQWHVYGAQKKHTARLQYHMERNRHLYLTIESGTKVRSALRKTPQGTNAVVSCLIAETLMCWPIELFPREMPILLVQLAHLQHSESRLIIRLIMLTVDRTP